MRLSQVLIPTMRDDPSGADVASHRLLLRAGLVRQLGSGLFTWLPLGVSVLQKVERIVREEMIRAGAQEVLMPVIQPAELWQESGRWEVLGSELLRMQDRNKRDYCFSPTHEEVVTDLFRQVVNSYRQLPCNLFQINTKFRDEVRPRFGVLRAREFVMKDAYSFHLDEDTLETTYRAMYNAYSAILTRLGLDFRAVEADAGAIGDGENHEFHVLAESGEDELVYSPNSDYAANVERAEAMPIGTLGSPTEAMKEIATPDVRTIAGIVEFVSCPIERTVKTLIVHGNESLIALIVRGDHDLNEAKAVRLADVAVPFRFATDEEIRSALACGPGSLGPVGLSLPTYIDRSAATLNDFVCGANRDDFHLTGVNWDRDVNLDPSRVVDIRKARRGDMAADGSGQLQTLRGIEVGHIFKLGDKYTRALGIEIQDGARQSRIPLMGCYGIGITRLVGALIEQHYDDKGILWPESASPALVHIIPINHLRSEAVRETAEQLYAECIDAGVDALIDDRDERPGVKFADAELIGVPHQVTVGDRALADGCVEYRFRREDRDLIPPSEILNHILSVDE